MTTHTRSPSPSPAPSAREPLDAVAAARAGDPRGEAALFQAFYATLRRQAARRLAALGPLADPSAVAVSAIKSLLEKFDPAHPKHDHVDHVTELGRAWAFVFTALEQRVGENRRAFRTRRRGGEAQTTSASSLPGGVQAADPTPAPNAALELEESAREIADLFERARARLSAREQQVVDLKLFEGLTMEQIAVALDFSKRTVEGDWTRAQRKLADFGAAAQRLEG